MYFGYLSQNWQRITIRAFINYLSTHSRGSLSRLFFVEIEMLGRTYSYDSLTVMFFLSFSYRTNHLYVISVVVEIATSLFTTGRKLSSRKKLISRITFA